MAEQNQNYTVYDFQSVGESLETYRENRRLGDSVVIPIGIKTPMSIATDTGGLFVMNSTLVSQIKDNLKNLLLTNHGERLGLYDYGANLKELTMELGSDNFDTEAIRRIKTACAKYMPYLNLSTFEPKIDKDADQVSGISMISVRVTFSIPLAESGVQAIEVVLYTAG
jgi:phage baseplate assembly protein W